MNGEREVPKGRFARASRMLITGGRTGLSLLMQTGAERSAEQALKTLGELRGLAAKVGQMASYVDGFIPDAQRETYGRILGQLQAATPASPFESVRALLEAELGGSLQTLFAELEAKPFASASIGQVHRARLHDGREVAVKIQHPGIAEAMDSDLKGASTLASLVSALGPRAVNADEVFAEVAQRFREELDYRHEAERQRTFAALHRGDDRVHVPAVIDSHSGARVLTTELVRAMDYATACTQALSLRRQYAEQLWRFVFRSILSGGVFNADPHPGNYLFHADGRISFLDFGCTQHVSREYQRATRAMHVAALADDRGAFHLAARAGIGTRAGAYETSLVEHLYHCFEPLRSSPYKIERDFVVRVVREIQTLKGHMLKSSSNVTPLPPGLVLLNRLQFGFYSVLAGLDVEADYAAVDRVVLSQSASRGDTPPALEPG